jgi:hypothetical protein
MCDQVDLAATAARDPAICALSVSVQLAVWVHLTGRGTANCTETTFCADVPIAITTSSALSALG